MNRVSLFAIPLLFRSSGENDRIVVMLTRERGKIAVLAKGIRRAHSKLAPFLSLLVPVRVEILDRQVLPILVGVRPDPSIGTFSRWSDDILNVALSQVLSSITDRLVADHDPDDEVFVWYVSSLVVLLRFSTHDPIAFEYYRTVLLYGFACSLLVLLGYGLEFDLCVKCRKTITTNDRLFLVFLLGGVVCQQCSTGQGYPLSQSQRAFLKLLFKGDISVLRTVEIPLCHAGVFSLCDQYLRYVCEKDLPSLTQYHEYVKGL